MLLRARVPASASGVHHLANVDRPASARGGGHRIRTRRLLRWCDCQLRWQGQRWRGKESRAVVVVVSDRVEVTVRQAMTQAATWPGLDDGRNVVRVHLLQARVPVRRADTTM